jgi:carbonic anhydrase/acetyltransferase-like protein (isoleucine patch superfamily)
VLFGAVVTAEDGVVEIGARCVVMENALVRGRDAHPTALGDDVLVGPHAHVNGSQVGDGCFLATGTSVFPGARLGRGVEVRINGIVHVNTALEDGAMVPIGWVAVGNPARIGDPLLALAELVDLREPVAHLGCVEHLVGGSLGVLAAVPEAELQPATVADAHHLELTKPGEAPAEGVQKRPSAVHQCRHVHRVGPEAR